MNEAAHTEKYYSHLRHDVYRVIPPDAKRVLSVGCASGRTEAKLVEQGIRVIGIELNPQAAGLARNRGIDVIGGDASNGYVDRGSERFDCIIYADVLEHLKEPVAVLSRHVRSLRSGGTVYITVPNFRHYSVFWELFVRGYITYREAGILDTTHIRITTKKMVLQWLENARLKLLNTRYFIHGRRNRLVSRCMFGLAREFLANQIAITASKT